MSGWIKLHRDILDHWIFSFKEPDKALAWIWMLTTANHAPSEFMIKGKLVKVGRGQIANSQISLQKEFGWSQNKVKRFLKVLKNERMIDFETNELTTLITICNYSKYQSDNYLDERSNERTDEQPLERTANDQSNDKQECNKNKKEKNPPKSKNKFSDDHLAFAQGMYKRILKVAEKTKEPNFEKWADVIRLMNEVDGHTLEEMANVFRFANADSFWKTNILSPTKFREKYATLHSKSSSAQVVQHPATQVRDIPRLQPAGSEQ